jgi:hypothetical protein
VHLADDFFVEITAASGGDGSEGKLFVAGNAELVGEEDVERKMEGVGDLKGDDDASSGDAEDDCVGAIGELGQVGGELASGVLTVLEDHGVTWALSLRDGPFREWFRDGYSFLVSCMQKVLKSSQQGC